MTSPVFANQVNLLGAVFTSGAHTSTTDPNNLSLPEPSDNLSLTDDANAYVVIDFGVATSVDTLAALYIGITGTRPTTWRWRGATSAGNLTSSPGYDSGTVSFASGQTGLPHRKSMLHDFLHLSSPVSYRFWRVDFNKACSIGNLIIDAGWQPIIGPADGFEPPWPTDSSVIKIGQSGRENVRELPIRDLAKFSLQSLSKVESLRVLRDFLEKAGTKKPVLAIFDPDEVVLRQELMLFGRMTTWTSVSNHAFELYSTEISMRELIP